MHLHFPSTLDTRRYFGATITAILLGVAGLAAGAGGATAMSSAASSKANKQADAAANKAKADAEQKALMDMQAEEKNKAARKSLLDTPTAGFGPNKNLARSFLTTL